MYGWTPFTVFSGMDGPTGGAPLSIMPPHIAITSATGTNPMVLTLASTPFPLTMAVNSTIIVANAAGTGCAGMNANQTITAVSGNNVTIAYNGSGCSYAPSSALAYSQDFVLRYHRDLTARQLIGEAWNIDGTGYTEAINSLDSYSALTLPGQVTFGPANVSLGFFRWYSGVIPAGSKPPNGDSANAGTVLADWEFEGSTADSGPYKLPTVFSPTPTYVNSPAYAPACSAGVSQSWAVGTSGKLDGSQSFALDGGSTLKYQWAYVPSTEPGTPTQYLQWSSATNPTPMVRGFIAGPLNFQLTVTDSSGRSTSCTVHDGAVNADSLGNVMVSDSRTASILGPLTMWGKTNSRWPWFDVVQKQWTDMIGGMQGTYENGKMITNFVDNWNVPLTGTVTATYGSVRVTGVNTTFRSTFCQGGSFTSVPQLSMIVMWYPKPGFIGGSGRRMEPVGKCVSDTEMDLGWQYSDDNGASTTAYNLDAPPGFAYTPNAALIWRPGRSCTGGPTTVNVNGLGVVALKRADGVTDPIASDCAADPNPNLAVNLIYNGQVFTIQGTFTPQLVYSAVWITLPGTTGGMQYAQWTQADLGSWVGIASNINYYDNALAFYTLYYRSGIDTYLHYARWLADRWWTMPYHDQGNSMSGQDGASLLPRNEAMTGLFLRAIDQDNLAGVPGASLMWPGLRVEVDSGFRYALNVQAANYMLTGDLRETAYNAMYVALCALADPDPVHAAACRSDLNNSILNTWKPQRQPDGSWQAFTGSYSSIGNTFAGMNTVYGTVTVKPGSNVVTIQGGTWDPSWFPAAFLSVGDPMNYATRDARYYGATFVDPTHIQLDRSYSDACGTNCAGRQWVISTGTPGTQWVGFGVQPFMLGITGQFFNQAYRALSMDPQYSNTAALAKSYVVDVANWLGTTGSEPQSRGLWYGVGFGICNVPSPAPSCYSNANPSDYVASRELSPEVLGAMAVGYSYAPSSALMAEIDNLFSAVYAKNPSDPGYDGTYAQDMDPLNGGFFVGTGNPKWLGFFFGMGRNASWLSAR